MKKINKHVEIVCSSDDSLNSVTEKSYLMIQQELSKHYKQVNIAIIDNEDDLAVVADKNPDVVFLCMKRIPRKVTPLNSAPYVWLSEYFESLGIPCTGSPAEAIRLEEEKAAAKVVMKKAGVNTAPFFVTYTGRHINKSQLPVPFPVFIKPPSLDAGIGIDEDSVVNSFREYKAKILSLEEKHSSEALVEEYLTGREFSVAVLKDNAEGHTVMPLEIIIEQQNDDEHNVVQVDDKLLAEQLSELALEAFTALGARDYGRIDIRMDSEGVPHFLEAGLTPRFVEVGDNFQKTREQVFGVSNQQMLRTITDLALSRPAIVIVEQPAPEPVASTA